MDEALLKDLAFAMILPFLRGLFNDLLLPVSRLDKYKVVAFSQIITSASGVLEIIVKNQICILFFPFIVDLVLLLLSSGDTVAFDILEKGIPIKRFEVKNIAHQFRLRDEGPRQVQIQACKLRI